MGISMDADGPAFTTSDVTVYAGGEGVPRVFAITLSCKPLDEHREFRHADPDLLVQIVRLQFARWQARISTLANSPSLEMVSGQHTADLMTEWAQLQLSRCEDILTQHRPRWSQAVWESLKIFPEFIWKHGAVEGVRYDSETGEPDSIDVLPALQPVFKEDRQFAVRPNLFDHLIPSRMRAKLKVADDAFATALNQYEVAQLEREQINVTRAALFHDEKEAYEQALHQSEEYRTKTLAKIEQLRATWMEKTPSVIAEVAALALDTSFLYPAGVPSPHIEARYLPESRMLIIDHQLPSPNTMPTLERVSYVKSRTAVTEKHMSVVTAQKRYDNFCYQLALRAIKDVFEEDTPNAIGIVTFNGWVEASSPSTGRLERACILSVQTYKEEFMALDLGKVDAKACFKALKGIAAISLSTLAPVRPMINLDRNDARFVNDRAIADGLNGSTNLAAMDWQDFEHLVRELFGQEFSGSNAEVRVTQASRDGGVDAIVLDPDPIKGGKIVIQAKRYTDTVDVSAVRDLYGTVMSEGANRGILVTTSSYGPDAYKFALGKPLTLLDGGQLLFLLAKHGHEATIDLVAARRQLHS